MWHDEMVCLLLVRVLDSEATYGLAIFSGRLLCVLRCCLGGASIRLNTMSLRILLSLVCE